MPSFWKKESERPTRHGDPDEAVAKYLEQLHQADVAGASPPASALNGLGDAYLDKGDVVSAVDYYKQAAEAYAAEGMHTNAIACLKKVRRHAPDQSDVGLLLGRYYAAKNLIPDALAELEGFATRQEELGNRRKTIEAMREVVGLVPEDGARRERLGDLLRADDQGDAAVSQYRKARNAYEVKGDRVAVERVRSKVADLGGAEAAAVEPEPAEGAPPAEERAAAEAPPPPEAPSEPREEELGLGLEIERTSYVDQEEQARPPLEEPSDPLTIAQQSEAGEDVEEDEREPYDIGESPALAEAAAELEQAATGSTDPESLTREEILALAERYDRAGDPARAAEYLLRAARDWRREGEWRQATATYQRLVETGEARAEDFEDWVECARQTGRANAVLEALESTSRWHLRRGEIPAARRAAEEMLLVDPDSETAAEILERTGGLSSS
ncbi:MAG: soluble NSF attachment family protein [Gemmatimonadetes bacterium]|nr:soluble NSF attachment family protein [Gemmatimonadota bacterium]